MKTGYNVKDGRTWLVFSLLLCLYNMHTILKKLIAHLCTNTDLFI